jgi:hypothetical protein
VGPFFSVVHYSPAQMCWTCPNQAPAPSTFSCLSSGLFTPQPCKAFLAHPSPSSAANLQEPSLCPRMMLYLELALFSCFNRFCLHFCWHPCKPCKLIKFSYPSLCALSVMSLEARPFQIFPLMRLYLLGVLRMVRILESVHAVNASNSMLALP